MICNASVFLWSFTIPNSNPHVPKMLPRSDPILGSSIQSAFATESKARLSSQCPCSSRIDFACAHTRTAFQAPLIRSGRVPIVEHTVYSVNPVVSPGCCETFTGRRGSTWFTHARNGPDRDQIGSILFFFLSCMSLQRSRSGHSLPDR